VLSRRRSASQRRDNNPDANAFGKSKSTEPGQNSRRMAEPSWRELQLYSVIAALARSDQRSG
jgi:hypothetical protein